MHSGQLHDEGSFLNMSLNNGPDVNKEGPLVVTATTSGGGTGLADGCLAPQHGHLTWSALLVTKQSGHDQLFVAGLNSSLRGNALAAVLELFEAETEISVTLDVVMIVIGSSCLILVASELDINLSLLPFTVVVVAADLWSPLVMQYSRSLASTGVLNLNCTHNMQHLCTTQCVFKCECNTTRV